MSVLAPGRNIVLIGMMGSGKTTVGRLLARRLDRDFVDTDDLIETEQGRSVPQIFADQGERAFRRIEAEVIRRVTALRGRIVAVGGGAVTLPENRTQLRMTGDLVMLEASAQTLAARLGDSPGDARPMLQGDLDPVERLAQLRADRDEAYRLAASHTIDTEGLAPDEIAEAIVSWARTRPGLLAREEVAGL
jgi:shikimate kinase